MGQIIIEIKGNATLSLTLSEAELNYSLKGKISSSSKYLNFQKQKFKIFILENN